MATCKDCIYSHLDIDVLTCRKEPPVVLVVRYRPNMNYNCTEDEVITVFPKVKPNTWCGRWAESSDEE